MFSWCPFPLLDNTISNGCQWSKQLETLWALLLLVLKLEIQSDKCEIYMAGLVCIAILCMLDCMPTGTIFSSMYDKNGWLEDVVPVRDQSDGQDLVLERVAPSNF
jgi:hypothetical protein